MIDPKVIDKIQKLLALGSNNGNEAEANSAMRKAAEIAEANNLSLSDVSPKGEVSNINKQGLVMGDKSSSMWTYQLANVIGRTCDTFPIVDKMKGQIIFVGTKGDLDMALWYFNLIRIRTLMSSKQFKSVKERNSFGVGVVSKISDRLREMYSKVQEEIRTETTKALVLVKKEEVEKAVHSMYPSLKTAKAKSATLDRSSYLKGIEAGSKMSLARHTITA